MVAEPVTIVIASKAPALKVVDAETVSFVDGISMVGAEEYPPPARSSP